MTFSSWPLYRHPGSGRHDRRGAIRVIPASPWVAVLVTALLNPQDDSFRMADF